MIHVVVLCRYGRVWRLQALHYRLEEVDQLNVKVKMMSRHIEVIQAPVMLRGVAGPCDRLFLR